MIDMRLGLRHRFIFETWIDSAGNRLGSAQCGSGVLVQLPQEPAITMKHEMRDATSGGLARRQAALHKFASGCGSIHKEAVEIIHIARSLDGLAADVFTKAHPHLLSAHMLHMPVLAAAARCYIARFRYCSSLASQRVLVKYFASAVVRAMNHSRVRSSVFLWGMFQRAAVRVQHSFMIAASLRICSHLRKRIVVWEVSRRWRATDVVVRKFRQKQRWRAWRKFVSFMNQIRVLIQRLLPYSRLRIVKQAFACVQR